MIYIKYIIVIYKIKIKINIIIADRVITRGFYYIFYITLLLIAKFYRYHFKIYIIIEILSRIINLDVIEKIVIIILIMCRMNELFI